MPIVRPTLALSLLGLLACSARSEAPPPAPAPEPVSTPAPNPPVQQAETHEAQGSPDSEKGMRPPPAKPARRDDAPPAPPPSRSPEAASRRDKAGRDERLRVGGAGVGGGAASRGGATADERLGVPNEAEDRAAPAPSGIVARRPAGELKAGRHDDNKAYPAFLAFLRGHAPAVALPWDVSERLTLRAVDSRGKSLANCALEVADLRGKALARLTTYADGQTQFFPTAQGVASDRDYTVQAHCIGEAHRTQLTRRGQRSVEVRFGVPRQVPARVPLDLAVVLDTTGSMQSQIDRLRETLEAIHFQITQLPTRPDVRFGLVAYRDRGDEYVTQVTPFTDDVKAFQKVLTALSADGGGDTPEDMQSGLEQAMHNLRWREDAVRVGFVVADAPPHTDYQQAYDYRAAMQESLQRGIKWTGVGVGGLPVEGELVLRQLAQATLGEYVFVTSGDGGDSSGSAAEASHHVGSNYHQENLDQAIVRIVRRELSYLGDDPRDFDDTLHATAEDGVGTAMAEVVRQLVDYSAMPLSVRTPVAVLPVVPAEKPARPLAGQLSEALVLAASRHPGFRVVERDLRAIAAELKVQLGDLADDTQAVPIGKLVGAQVLVTSRVGINGELYARLVRVETGEVLSVARVVALPIR